MYPINKHIRDFEFYYLAELTRQRIKPLSRWEKPIPQNAHHWLRRQGLFAETVTRRTVSGKQINETVFSGSCRYTDVYYRKFNDTLIDHSAGNQGLEGFLFGYPSCCVRNFVDFPYAPNGLPNEIQSLLFHWACPSCRSTADLIPYYHTIHQTVLEWHRQQYPEIQPFKKYKRSFSKAIAALLLAGGYLSAQTVSDSTHFIPLPGDTVKNGLTYAEEIYLGTFSYNDPLEHQGHFAQLYRAIIDSLPDTVQTDRAYLIDNAMRGIIPCPKCGKYINMGYVTIVNPKRDLQMDIQYMGLHFMEYGSFSYGSDENYQRIDIDSLKRILFPYDPAHMLSVPGDNDKDGLTDAEEDSLWMDYTADIADFNNDGVPDGANIAEELIRLFPKLKEEPDGLHSSVKFQPVWGLETCKICGSIHNMGYLDITNPENNRNCQIPFLSLHAMTHGSFTCDGTVHDSTRVNVIELYRTMKTHMLVVSDDADNDGLTDAEEEYFGFDPNKTDSDNDGVADGMELALTYADTIKSLPTEPRPDGPYAEFLGMDGIHLCAVCGEEVVMGEIKIYNPLVSDEPVEFTFYSLHFLEKGSFSSEGAHTYPSDELAPTHRIDPVRLSQYLGYPSGNAETAPTHSPANFRLEQNYPNPFNPSTVIQYEIPVKSGKRVLSGIPSASRGGAEGLKVESNVGLCIYDCLGQKVATLVSGLQAAGTYTIEWNGMDMDNKIVNSGLYIYTLTVDGASLSRKMLFLR